MSLAQSSGTDLQDPTVISISKVGDSLLPVTGATFDVLITLSEMPKKDGFKKDQIDVSHATAADPVAIAPVKVTAAFADDGEGDLNVAGTRGTSTGRDGMHHRYVVTITPKYENKNDIVVKVKMFYDQEKVSPNSYTPKTRAADYTEGDDKLTVKVGKETAKTRSKRWHSGCYPGEVCRPGWWLPDRRREHSRIGNYSTCDWQRQDPRCDRGPACSIDV